MIRNRFKNEKYNDKVKVPHNFQAIAEGDTLTLNIYGEIGDYWWDSTSAADVSAALEGVEASEIIVNISSPGGSAFDGIAIYNLLKNHSANVTINVPGWACSAASVIAMAADVLNIGDGAMVMIHPASTAIWGDKSDFDKESKMLGKLDESIINIYMNKFNGTREELKVMVDNETWFTAQEAVDAGFANSISKVVAPTNKLDSEAFKNSVLARFRKEPAANVEPEQTDPIQTSFLNRFKK